MSRALSDGLAKLVTAGGMLHASGFTSAQRQALSDYAQRTEAIGLVARGAGKAFVILARPMVDITLGQLRPIDPAAVPTGIPDRARNIAARRSSKAGKHRTDTYHLLLRPAPAGKAIWSNGDGGFLDLVDQCALTGSASIAVKAGDGWGTDGQLWLVENQTLFDDLSWMPAGATGSVLFYSGVLDGRLLDWLRARRRHGRLILFPDYDGVGLHQYAKLAASGVNKDVEFWLLPEWEALLERCGSSKVWADTLVNFNVACKRMKGTQARYRVLALCDAMQRQGLALEQEAVWLSGHFAEQNQDPTTDAHDDHDHLQIQAGRIR